MLQRSAEVATHRYCRPERKPCLLAILAIAAMSVTRAARLARLSVKISASCRQSGLETLCHVVNIGQITSQPNFLGIACDNWLIEPPLKLPRRNDIRAGSISTWKASNCAALTGRCGNAPSCRFKHRRYGFQRDQSFGCTKAAYRMLSRIWSQTGWRHGPHILNTKNWFGL